MYFQMFHIRCVFQNFHAFYELYNEDIFEHTFCFSTISIYNTYFLISLGIHTVKRLFLAGIFIWREIQFRIQLHNMQ